MCDLLRLTNDTVNKKTYKWVLTVIDIASRFKWAVPLTLKNSSEVTKAFKKIYDNSNVPLPGLIYYNAMAGMNGWVRLQK